MTKMTDAEYLVRLPDLGLIVQVKKWRLSNAFFNGPGRELIKVFHDIHLGDHYFAIFHEILNDVKVHTFWICGF